MFLNLISRVWLMNETQHCFEYHARSWLGFAFRLGQMAIFRDCYTVYCSMQISKYYMRPQNTPLVQSACFAQPYIMDDL